ncbi:MAG: ABC-2 transporter permease [Oscillibacter sp.]|nr:ABC-2 transporter permease [Oscillibacter sp.]
MKALMRKDFYVLKKQIWLYAVIICLFQTFSNGTATLISILYAVLLPVSAFAYDDRSHWDEMELMLPYSTRQIVLSRYFVGWISMLGFLILGSLAQGAMSFVSQYFDVLPKLMRGDSFRALLAEIPVAACFLSLSMPVYFRFDAEKSRAVRTLLIFVLCALMGGGIALVSSRNIAFDDELFQGGFERFLWAAYLASAVLTAVSIPLSVLAWNRRHR